MRIIEVTKWVDSKTACCCCPSQSNILLVVREYRDRGCKACGYEELKAKNNSYLYRGTSGVILKQEIT